MRNHACFKPQSQVHVTTEDTASFCYYIAEELERLLQVLSKNSISLKWSIESMEFLKRMQKELLAILKKSKLSVTLESEDDWFDQYMQETVTLLDFCNSLRYSLSRINRYRMMTDLIVLKLSEANISDAANYIRELEFELIDRGSTKFFDTDAVFERLRFLIKTLSCKSRSSSKSVAIILLAAETTMMILSLLLVSAFIHPISLDIKAKELSLQIPELRPCVNLLNELVNCFYTRKSTFDNSGGLILAEHQKVAEMVEKLKIRIGSEHVENVEQFFTDVDRLKRRSFELKEGIERFDATVNEVFDYVMKGRNEMMQNFREGTLTVD